MWLGAKRAENDTVRWEHSYEIVDAALWNPSHPDFLYGECLLLDTNVRWTQVYACNAQATGHICELP